MDLTLKERIVLLGVLPKEGDFKTLKQLRQCRESLAMTDEEIKVLKVVSNPQTGMVNWTEPVEGEPYKADIEIKDSVMELIVDALVQADKQKKLNEDTFDLYEKFVVNAKNA